MVSSGAATVKEYLASLPAERRRAIGAVRRVILKNLPSGYREVMQYGMISYVIPLSVYPDTYNKQPLAIASLASQKNYMALYLMGVYSGKDAKAFEKAYKATGKTLDMGKCCVRFKTLDDLPLGLIGKTIAKVSVKRFIKQYEAAHG